MLGFSLAPAEDEAFYSIVARHGELVGRRDAGDLTSAFLASAGSVVSFDHPSGLDHAATRLGVSSGTTLLKAHTAYPYNTVFATVEHQNSSKAWALRGEGARTGEVGVSSGLFRHRPTLAFCRQCVYESRGEGTCHPWHRAHQLPGIFVCHQHGTTLQATDIARSGRRGARAFVALTDAIARTAAAAPHIQASDGRVLLRYARASARLLDEFEPLEIGALQARMRELLTPFRWERASSLIAMSRLVETLSGHPNVTPLLRAMKVGFSNTVWATALHGLLYRTQCSKHPLLVLMLLETIDASLDDLLVRAREVPASDGVPYVSSKPGTIDLCANLACPEMQSAVLAAFMVGESRRATCRVCGFAIRAANRPGQRPVILRTCAAWDAAVAAALSNPATSVRAVSRTFNADATTIVRAARRCGLWRDEWKTQSKLSDRINARVEALRQVHRNAWLMQPTKSATLPIKQLPKSEFNAYRWLLRHDRAWFYAHGGPGTVRRHSWQEQKLPEDALTVYVPGVC